MSNATPRTRTAVITVRIRLPRAVPVSTEAREIGMVRKRVMMRLPLECERAQHVYGQPSAINKLLIITGEAHPGRITMVLVKQPLGF